MITLPWLSYMIELRVRLRLFFLAARRDFACEEDFLLKGSEMKEIL